MTSKEAYEYMREILFRGKRLDNGEWVYGGYHFEHGFGDPSHYIVEYSTFGAFTVNNLIKVEPETVGQFTGMLDKNGDKIFEGDVLSLKDEVGKKGIVTVGFEDGGFIVFKGLAWRYIGVYHNIGNELEVIGNIHDNKENNK